VWLQVTEHVTRALPEIMPLTYGYMDEVMDIEESMRKELQAMPPEDFINVLRPGATCIVSLDLGRARLDACVH
jgi:hypothetical protein